MVYIFVLLKIDLKIKKFKLQNDVLEFLAVLAELFTWTLTEPT